MQVSDLKERLRAGVLHKMWDDGDGSRMTAGPDIAAARATMAEAASEIERLEAEVARLSNDNPLVSYDGARFQGEHGEVLIAATPDFIRCPRPANHRPDDETVETCNASDNCGCCYGDRALASVEKKP